MYCYLVLNINNEIIGIASGYCEAHKMILKHAFEHSNVYDDYDIKQIEMNIVYNKAILNKGE